MTKDKDLSKLSDDELEALEADLAAERTSVRLRQNDVAAERDLRRALASLSPESRRIVSVRMGGELAPQGAAEA